MVIAEPVPTTAAACIFEATNPGFQQHFDEQPFEFTHTLSASHPLFTTDAVRRLLSHPDVLGDMYYDAGEIRVDQRWDSVAKEKPPIEVVYDRIDTAGAWIMLRRLQKLPAYNALLQACLAEVQRLSGRQIEGDAKSQEIILFVTSPNRVTSYHIDRECNFLMQIGGRKAIHVFDRNDREVVPEHELEQFWSKDNNAGIYKPQFENRAYVYTMRPGTGVHIPVNAPHWLQNGDNISVSLSISYQYQDWRRKNVYQANYYLRRLGIKPTPPGRSALLDYGKRLGIAGALRAKKLLKH